MSADSLNIQRGTTRLDQVKGTTPLASVELSAQATVAQPQAEKDNLSLGQTVALPDVGLSKDDKHALATLTPGLQNLVTTKNISPAMPEVAKREVVISNLKAEIDRLAIGGVKFEENGAKWGISELAAVYNSLQALPLKDRSNLTFRRMESFTVECKTLPATEVEGAAKTENVVKKVEEVVKKVEEVTDTVADSVKESTGLKGILHGAMNLLHRGVDTVAEVAAEIAEGDVAGMVEDMKEGLTSFKDGVVEVAEGIADVAHDIVTGDFIQAKTKMSAAVACVYGEMTHLVSDEGLEGGFVESLMTADPEVACREEVSLQKVIVITDKGANRDTKSTEKLVMHELAHQTQLKDGGWEPEKVKEFAKLSGWQEYDSEGNASAADGIDNKGGQSIYLPSDNIRPTKTTNFIDAYAKTTPTEDYAESYTAFVENPQSLMEHAPDKFLYLNSETRKYTSDQVAAWAAEKKVDLTKVATGMVLEAGLKTETMTNVCSVNNVSTDKEAIAKAAQKAAQDAKIALDRAAWDMLKGNSNVQPADHLGAAASALTQAALDGAKDAEALIEDMIERPEEVLGKTILAALSPEEKKVLTDKDFLEKAVAGIQAGAAANNTVADDVKYQLAREGMNQLMTLLIDPKNEAFREDLADDPQKALEKEGIWDALPEEMRQPLVDPANRKALRSMLDALPTRGMLDAMKEAFATQPKEDPVAKNLESYVQKLTPESFTAFAQQLSDKDLPEKAAATLKSIMETGLAPQSDGAAPMC